MKLTRTAFLALLVVAALGFAPTAAAAAGSAAPALVEGVLGAVVSDPVSGGASISPQHVLVGDRTLLVTGPAVGAPVGARVLVPGSATGTVSGDEVQRLPAVAAGQVVGERSALFVPIFMTGRDELRPAAGAAQLNGTVSDWFEENSHGLVTLRAVAVPWQRVAAGGPGQCDENRFGELKEKAADAARRVGQDPDAYDHVVVYVSGRDCRPSIQQGEAPGRFVVLRGSTVSLEHELGHNLGLYHANLLQCYGQGRLVVLSGECSDVEYGDPYSAMGDSLAAYQLSAPHRAQLGWLGGQTKAVTRSGTYQLAALERPGGDVAALTVDTGYRTYWLESRRRVGVDGRLPLDVTDGALVHLAGYGATQLLDLTPASSAAVDPDLDAGRTAWTDPEGSVRLSVGVRTSAGLPVTVTFLPTWAPPVQALAASAGPQVRLTWQAWPGRTPDAVVVRAQLDTCPQARTAGRQVGGTAWRTAQLDVPAAASRTCYAVFARYGDSWASPAPVYPGCGSAAVDAVRIRPARC